MNDYTKLQQEISVWRNLYEQTMQAGHCSSEAKARADAALLAFREAFPGPFERDYTALHGITGTAQFASELPTSADDLMRSMNAPAPEDGAGVSGKQVAGEAAYAAERAARSNTRKSK